MIKIRHFLTYTKGFLKKQLDQKFFYLEEDHASIKFSTYLDWLTFQDGKF